MKLNLKKIVFTFDVGTATWNYEGRGEVSGKEYASVYSVEVLLADKFVSTFKTSFQANVSNSKDMITKAINAY
jgi:hypothetical protein